MPEDEVIQIESYISIDDVKSSNIAIFEGLEDSYIQKRLNNLSRVIDEYCNTKFTPTEDNWRTDLRARNKVPRKPLISVESVEVRGSLLSEDTDYYVYEEKNLIEIENISEYKNRKKALTLNYTYGYREVPAIVKEVLLELFKDGISNLTHTVGRVKSEQWEDYSYTLDNSDTIEPILLRLSRFIEEDEVERQSNKIRAMLL